MTNDEKKLALALEWAHRFKYETCLENNKGHLATLLDAYTAAADEVTWLDDQIDLGISEKNKLLERLRIQRAENAKLEKTLKTVEEENPMKKIFKKDDLPKTQATTPTALPSNPEANVKLVENIALSYYYKEFLINTRINNERGYLQSDMKHLPPHYDPISCVVCGSGPSLIEDVEIIRTLQREGEMSQPVIVFSNQSNFSFLVNNGIPVNYCILTDKHPDIYNRILETVPKKRLNVNYICSQHCHPNTLRFAANHGNLYTFKQHLMPHTDHRGPMYNDVLDIMCPDLSTFIYQFGNVSNASILIAAELHRTGNWDIRNIILSGVDNSWTKDHERVPYYSAESGAMIESPYHPIAQTEEYEPGLFTNSLMRAYDADLNLVTDGIKELHGIRTLATSNKSFSQRRYPLV